MDINSTVREILKKRGFEDESEIEEFLSPKPSLTYDPFLLYNMKEGVDFVLDSVKNGERICIYGDYDVDGITATALLYSFLHDLTPNVTYHIPSRFDEGYGLNNDAITQFKEDGVDTIITVDCGSVSKNEIDYAKSIGLNVLVTDHHNMEQNTAPDCIVINPKHYNTEYPFSELCGCAVVFKLIQAIVRTENLDSSYLKRPLDLVAIATVADVMPLIDENRTIVKYGLREINRGNRKALRILMNKLQIEPGSVDAYKIGFVIGPHINAAGRMSDANAVVQMLISDDNREISEISDLLISHNKDRKKIQEKCFEECIEIIEDKYKESSFLMVNPPSIHEGISGIVAGKVREKYNRPAAILAESVDEQGSRTLKASARSIDNVNLIKTLLNHEELFLKVGGHAMAAGFTIPINNEDKLRAALEKDMNEELKNNPNLFEKTIEPDASIEKEDVTKSLTDEINLMAPFGVGNPRPVLRLPNIVFDNPKYMGSDNLHVKFSAGNFDCILFGKAQEYSELLKEGTKLTLFGSPDINKWNGRESVQFLIKDIECQEG